MEQKNEATKVLNSKCYPTAAQERIISQAHHLTRKHESIKQTFSRKKRKLNLALFIQPHASIATAEGWNSVTKPGDASSYIHTLS